MPELLGGGIPLLPPTAKRPELKLTSHKVYKTGIVSLDYTVQHAPSRKAMRPTRSAASARQACQLTKSTEVSLFHHSAP